MDNYFYILLINYSHPVFVENVFVTVDDSAKWQGNKNSYRTLFHF